MANAEEIDSPDWEEPPSTTSSLGRALEDEILPRRLFGGELATEASPQTTIHGSTDGTRNR